MMLKRVLTKFCGYFGVAVQYGCVAHCTFEYLGDFVICSGPSMEPTLHSDDILLTEHVSPRLQTVKRGDIIIARCPHKPQEFICKRVAGLPGDRIKTGFASHTTVPFGHVWLEGDNSRNSTDSRMYGPVAQGLIVSRAMCKVWPFKNFTIFSSNDDNNNARKSR